MTLRVLLEWLIIFVLSVVFFASGMSKVTGQPWDLEDFQKLGMGFQMVHLVGAAEVLAVFGLFVERYKVWSATLLAVVSFGAIVVHVLLDDLVEMGGPLVLGFLSAALVYLFATAPNEPSEEREKAS